MLTLQAPRQAAAVPSLVAGEARIAVVRGAAGRSVVTRAYASSPLRLLLPRNHGTAAWVYTSTYGGGLVDGDHLRLDINVGPSASAYLGTQASTKVYRSRQTGSDLQARVGADGLLVLVPDPVVCFAGSRYRQAQDIDLADDAALVLVDWLSSGRHAAGERWKFDDYSARLRVRVNGQPIVHDALSLRAEDQDLAMRMGRFEILATALVLGPGLRRDAAEIVERVGQTPVSGRAGVLLAASPVGDGGCLLRIAGTSVEETGKLLRQYLQCVPRMIGDDPWARKW